jgi:hypothetical protein
MTATVKGTSTKGIAAARKARLTCIEDPPRKIKCSTFNLLDMTALHVARARMRQVEDGRFYRKNDSVGLFARTAKIAN